MAAQPTPPAYDPDAAACAKCGTTRGDVMACDAASCRVRGCRCVVAESDCPSGGGNGWWCVATHLPDHALCRECA